MKEIKPIAFFHSPFTSKFGIPRQSNIAKGLKGRIVFEPEYRHPDALRGLESFDYVWLIWDFSANRESDSLTVRPPRLGGNQRVGVFASRSPFRPNGLGLSSVRISAIADGEIEVEGADLMNGTPIYDIKPYIAYADAHPEARGGFTDTHQWKQLRVVIDSHLLAPFSDDDRQALLSALAHDPRPHYHDDPARIYGMPFAGCDVRFRVDNGTLTVTDIVTDE